MPMLHDFDLIQHKFNSDIDIYPIADVHLGAVEHAETEWQAFLKRVERENAYLILAGDLLNNSTRGVRFANPFDEVLRPREAKKRMMEYLSPIKDRVLCVVDGNHEQRTVRESDQSLSYDICSKLDIEHLYRENMAFVKCSLGQRNRDTKCRQSYVLCVTHGRGGGIYTGAAVNSSERFGNLIEGVDCIVTGHVHKGYVTKPAKIVVDSVHNWVGLRPYTVISCISWLNYGGYAARSMLLPAQIADPQRLHLVMDEHHKQIITTW